MILASIVFVGMHALVAWALLQIGWTADKHGDRWSWAWLPTGALCLTSVVSYLAGLFYVLSIVDPIA